MLVHAEVATPFLKSPVVTPDLFCLTERGQPGGVPETCHHSLTLTAFCAKVPGVWGSRVAGHHCIPDPHHLSWGLASASVASRGVQRWVGRQAAWMCLVRLLWWGKADLCLTRHTGGRSHLSELLAGPARRAEDTPAGPAQCGPVTEQGHQALPALPSYGFPLLRYSFPLVHERARPSQARGVEKVGVGRPRAGNLLHLLVQAEGRLLGD